jgi:hypothetical protein
MASTPSKQEDHPFLNYLEKAEVTGSMIKKIVYDCPRITPKMIEEYMEEAGGEDSENWKREYLCQIVRSQELTVLPEFDEGARNEIIQTLVRPPFVDRYVGMDLGFVDYTGVLFGYYNFVDGRIVIERELLVNRENTSIIAAKIGQLERAIWNGNPPFKRVSDTNNPQFIYDLSTLHGLQFGADPRVGTKEQRINKLRLLIQRREIVIDPSCKNLIAQMTYARWKNSERLTFDRSEAHGHYDLVDALIILVNNVVRGRNPVPVEYDVHSQYHLQRPAQPTSPLINLVNPNLRKIRRPF